MIESYLYGMALITDSKKQLLIFYHIVIQKRILRIKIQNDLLLFCLFSVSVVLVC